MAEQTSVNDHIENLRRIAGVYAHVIGCDNEDRLYDVANYIDNLTVRLVQAERDASRFESDLTALHGDYEELELRTEQAEQRIEAIEHAGYV